MSDSSNAFVFEKSPVKPAGSVLYYEHLKLTNKAKMADFAGYLMPLWYNSISDEHAAVRNAAGLFDCSHMGVIEIAGRDALLFLNTIATNDVNKVSVGKAQYSYLLDSAGNVLDDVIIYRRDPDKYMLVVNAANEAKIKAWLKSLLTGQTPPNPARPDEKIPYSPDVRDMKDTTTGSDCRVDIALQGPASIAVLSNLTTGQQHEAISRLKPFRLIEQSIGGINCIISRTGYTGAKSGFELFVHPQDAAAMWRKLLEQGKPAGLLPCGLGARDSLRIEAGLPLYGHELNGKFGISPLEAGYAWAVKFEKDFFIGREPMQQLSRKQQMQVIRLALPGGKGIRPARFEDGILDQHGNCLGWLLSCAKVEDRQIALAYVQNGTLKEADPVGLFYLARRKKDKNVSRKTEIKQGEKVEPDLKGRVLPRFARF